MAPAREERTMRPVQLKAIEDGFGKVAPIAERAATAWSTACGLFAQFMIAEVCSRPAAE
jgi:hypothetical protein